MIEEKVKSKIERLDNQIEQMKETHREFRMPDFEKYDGKGCPQDHLHLYRIEISQYAKNEKLLVRFFQ